MSRAAVLSLAGEFWLPGDNDRVSGRMYFGEKNWLETDATLVGSLVVWKTNPDGGKIGYITTDGPPPTPVIHGRTESGDAISLFDCHAVGDWPSSIVPGESCQRVLPIHVIQGAHLDAEPTFTRVRLRFAGVAAWAHGAELADTVKLSSGGSLRLVHEDPDDELWIEFTDLRAATWRPIDQQFLMPLSTLITIATGFDCPLLQAEVGRIDGEWLPVLTSRDEPPEQELLSHRALLPLRHITVTGIATWLDQSERLSPIPPIVANSVRGAGQTLETETLVLTTVAEGLHAVMYPNERRMSKELAKNVRKAAVAAAVAVSPVDEAHEIRSRVESMLSRLAHLSYKDRLRQLAEDGENLAPGITGDTKEWIAEVENARNHFAHLGELGFLTERRIDQSIAVIGSVRWLLVALLLAQTGCPAETIRSCLDRHNPYVTFLNQAHKYLPSVYRSESTC